MNTDNIVVGDCIEGMKSLEDNLFNLIVADPPYNLDKDFGVYKELEQKSVWKSWTREWLAEALRVLSDKGNILVYGHHQHQCWVQCAMFELGFIYRRQIIWYYQNGFSGHVRTLTSHYEPLLWFSKTHKGYIYHTIRVPYKHPERLKYRINSNGKKWMPNPDGSLAGDVWEFPVLSGKPFQQEKVDHPTQKPLSISRRIVKHFSNAGDTILVPFAGSGTECVAAAIEGRNYLGFELNPEYVSLANSRLEQSMQNRLV